MRHKFKFSVGDWSGDGHGQHAVYVIESNKAVEDVRESYFAIKDKLGGVGLERQDYGSNLPPAPANKYENSSMTQTWLDAAQITDKDLRAHTSIEADEDDAGTYHIGAEEMAELFVLFMNKHDPSLDLKLIDDDIPTFHFYGFDAKKRHISFIGYGCF